MSKVHLLLDVQRILISTARSKNLTIQAAGVNFPDGYLAERIVFSNVFHWQDYCWQVAFDNARYLMAELKS